jgi:N-acetylglutamate synthase-like GNAT family acetyltransferase/DNA-binding MarR family transcriptional regulator
MAINKIYELRNAARKLVRELGMLQLSESKSNRAPQHWHALIEIANSPNITLSELGHLLVLTPSTMSRVITALAADKLVDINNGADKREKYLTITLEGLNELKIIDDYSHGKIRGALEFINENDVQGIIDSLYLYANSLEKSRIIRENVKINTLSTSRIIRKQIMQMIRHIQVNEFKLNVADDINDGILKAEEEYYFKKSYNFWYATDENGNIVGSIGLKKIDKNSGEIKKFFVREDYRGKGVANKLLQALLKACEKHKMNRLYLGTVHSLHDAHRFYMKYHFEPIAENLLPEGFEKCEIDTHFYRGNVRLVKAKSDLML